ncbi:MAG: cupin domain-containing protein [Chloroflexota bacterium]|nr:MAG: cupin domain-containing protein [Chloroflexota bacterium]
MSESLVAHVAELAALAEYQADSIVSRTLINKPSGTVTLFAFAQGQSLSEHTAPYDALAQILDGRAEIRIAAETFQVEQGQAIILPANVPHAVNAVETFKMLLTMIRS